MSDVKFLLKFGKKEHIQQFVAGSLFCSNAATFWGIEKDLKIKGQGDVLEAGSRMFAQKLAIQPHGSDETTIINMKSNSLVHYEPAENIPVFCLFSVFEEDCTSEADGNLKMVLSNKTKAAIRGHFPNADSVAIITNPEQFLEDVEKTIGYPIKHELVHYFNIDKGYNACEGGATAMDMEYMMYLVQDVPPVIENGMKRYVFHADYVYRVLFCKDVFFEDEQEYRIVLPDEKITKGTHFPVQLSEDIEIRSLDEFMK